MLGDVAEAIGWLAGLAIKAWKAKRAGEEATAIAKRTADEVHKGLLRRLARAKFEDALEAKP